MQMFNSIGITTVFTLVEYWDIINQSLSNSKNQDEQEAWLISHLQNLEKPDTWYLQNAEEPQIVDFFIITHKLIEHLFNSPNWEYKCSKLNLSDDGSEYFACWIISKGEQYYESILFHPDWIVDGEPNFERFSYIPYEALKRKNGKDIYELLG